MPPPKYDGTPQFIEFVQHVFNKNEEHGKGFTLSQYLATLSKIVVFGQLSNISKLGFKIKFT